MKQLLFIFVVCISCFQAMADLFLERNRDRVACIIEKLPEETKDYDKIIWGDDGFYYFVVVNDSNYTQYFAYPDTTISHLVIDCVQDFKLEREITDFSPYFDIKGSLIKAPENNVEPSTLSSPAYIAYIHGDCILSDSAFLTFAQWPITTELMLYLFFKTRYIILNNYPELYLLIRQNGSKWNTQAIIAK